MTMRKTLIISISLVCILTVYLCLIAVEVSHAQAAEKSQGDLYGENDGDSIVLQWDLQDGAKEYVIYRSTSLAGPWVAVGRPSDSSIRTGGAKEYPIPDATLMDLCFKVEAIDAIGVVIKTYEPICVPRFVP
jgi:hypothetical protein